MAKQEFELAHRLSLLQSKFRAAVPVVDYMPTIIEMPPRHLDRKSAWEGLESILLDIIRRFELKTDRCLEFGVEFGYSTVALSSFFKSVRGVDTFQGDRHTTIIRDTYQEALENVSPYDNIELIRSDYQSYVKTDSSTYDLIHVDIIHTFADTYACGLWSAEHSKCTIFHDTESFPQVKQAVSEIARKTGKTFYNFPECYGLGIVV
ncbi:class I SAM-dependent methyltransferase [Granulicella tundricola]|uniref:O-methyltransferase family 3 n=1 Tax=Granulicella tundricola (strain ATCC BAA-1859 / DSM 23138 / MP5ACTX9) TaxID=1198114 RepID=E8X269_GRATM|nr:class I SAM-dependent methyltransferase [Granulicella tundricola]ADW70312.1 hypothetical protein AciX9_3301 [Granulicella tundricola MP5ACTX9]